MQRFSLGSNQYRGLRGWSAAPIFFGVRRPTPDGLDVARAQFEVIRHGLPCFVEPIHPRGRYRRTWYRFGRCGRSRVALLARSIAGHGLCCSASSA
jgi:hypothetical protein